ncbi:MAG: hypothetical protein OHK0031_02000 [Anaerolineales bacterium]
MTVLRWLHVSDFHFGRDKVEIEEVSRQIVQHVKEKQDAGFGPQMIFVTGDIAFSGQDLQYQKFNQVFLEPLINFTENIFLVPGNHDLDRNKGATTVRKNLPYEFQEYFDNNDDGLKLRNEMLQTGRFEGFISNDITYNGPNHWLNSIAGSFHKVIEFGDIDIGVVGVNTAWLCTGRRDGPLDEDERAVTPGYNLLRSALQRIEHCDYRIVLGHHPVEWFFQDMDFREGQTRIKDLFEQNQVLYLHGHTHYAGSAYGGVGRPYLSLGAGACFAARDNSKWVNGFFWAELDTDTNVLAVEPLFRKGEIWETDTRINFPKMVDGKGLFSVTRAQKPISPAMQLSQAINVPVGWTKIDQTFLELQKSQPVSDDKMLYFFDGVEPIWAQASRPDLIPRRPIVFEVSSTVKNAIGKPETLVFALLGPGGEGKTTALMQSVCQLVDDNAPIRILWQENKDANWPALFFESLPFYENQGWLIVSNWADAVIPFVQKTAMSLNQKGRHDIHFLISCRTFDWRSSNASRIPWGIFQTKLIEKRLSGMTLDESQMVVNAWSKYERQGGLGSLRGLSNQAAVQRLCLAAGREEFSFGLPAATEKDADGSFLGAILTVRNDGDALKDHVLDLLNSIESSKKREGIPLIRCFAFIAYMHSAGLPYLSKNVLAKALGTSMANVTWMIATLADEALVADTGSRVLTRHQLVAKVAIELLPNFEIDPIDDVFIVLLQAAFSLFKESKLSRDEMAQWNRLPNDIFDNRNEELAIKLAEGLRHEEPWNTHWVTTLSSLLRKTNDGLKDIIDMYHYDCDDVERDRAFYFEWALNEERAGNLQLAVWLVGVSLSDWPEKSLKIDWHIPTLAEDVHRLHRSLEAMQRICELVNDYKEIEKFKLASNLCKDMLENVSTHFGNIKKIFFDVVASAWNGLEDELINDLPDWLISTDRISFNELEKHYLSQ